MSSPTPSSSTDLDLKLKKRIWIVEAYWFFQKSYERVIREFQQAFPTENPLAKTEIHRTISRFHEHASVLDLRKGHSGRPSSTSPEEVTEVEEFFNENPTTSFRRASQSLGIARSTLHRIVRKKLNLYPYKIQLFQELSPVDIDRRLEFASLMLQKILDRSINPKNICFSDEAHFWLTGYVNKQNYRFWAKENPTVFQTTSLKPQKLTVWCAISRHGIVGPIFFDHTVNGERYERMLREEFIPAAYGLNSVEDFWFMQDGATPHKTKAVFQCIEEHFSKRVIAQDYPSRCGGGMDWPPYSPDLNPCDFFLWGNLKDKVYRQNPLTIEELSTAISREIQSIDKKTLKTVIEGFENRLYAIIDKEGAHIEQYYL